jgi:DNA-binding beta-propeller fold protein YncE
VFGLTTAASLDGPGLTWFNVDGPLSANALHGRFVVLEFWTACCVNCLNTVPILRRIQETWRDKLVVIGVHSPKYPAERDPAIVANALARYGIEHPVVHDPELALWSHYGISGWPTLVFIDPDGMVLGDLQGEPCETRFISGIGEMLRRWPACGARRAATLAPVRPASPASGSLRFPVKIKPLPTATAERRWAVADSGHHQVVVFDDNGREIARYGCGTPGFIDLDGAHSAFNSPEGVAADVTGIYVADTGNHAIRRIDLATTRVTTLAGTGERGSALNGTSGANDVALASVTDLAVADGQVFFANAGTHQIGIFDSAKGRVEVLAGSGTEALADNADARLAGLAQPRGLAMDGGSNALYFADSDASALRRVCLGSRPRVETLIGAGLVDFGAVDGPLDLARMQYCCGVSIDGDRVFVADSYNGTIRLVDLVRGRVQTLVFSIEGGGEPPVSGLACPGGVIAAGGDRLLIAETNHHRILEVNLAAQHARVWAH